MARKYDIYGMGNALVDIVTEVDDVFMKRNEIDKGLMTLVDEDRQERIMRDIDLSRSARQCGGSAANTVIGASQLGASCYYSCKVADDELGAFYLADLRANGVDTSLDSQPLDKGATGRCLVMTTADAERSMMTFLGITADYSSKEIDAESLVQSEYLYIEGYLVASPSAREAMVEAKTLAEGHGVKTALTLSDPNMVKFFGDELRRLIGEGVDLLFCNEDEATLFAEAKSLEEAKETLKRHARRFAITRGPEGALLYDGGAFIDVAPVKVEAFDTNGAGDLFAGAFLYGLTHGLSFEQSGQLASAASARLVEKLGPRLDKPQLQEILQATVKA